MPDGTWAVHRKLHVFEHPNICAGDRYTVFDTPHGCRVGVLICYDNNIVENARVTALLGAEILARQRHVPAVQQRRRPDDDEIRTGNAMVLDPYGEVIAETREAGDDIVESLTRATGQEQETRRVRFGE